MDWTPEEIERCFEDWMEEVDPSQLVDGQLYYNLLDAFTAGFEKAVELSR
jgi:hypothetical protein